MEVVIAIGPSTDRTDEIAAELVAEDPRVHTVPNPTGRTPAALNAAIKASRHPIVVRVDGHGMLSPNYIATAVRLLEETGAQNVGGIMHAEGENDWEHAVAAAMTSKIGVGNAAFHTGGAGRPGRDRVPRRLPPRGAGATGRLQRGVHPRPGLGAELPDPRGRRPDLVLARAEGVLPAAPQRAGRSPSSTRTTAAGGTSSPATTRAPSTCATSPRRPRCARSPPASWSGAALTPLGFVIPAGYLAAIVAGSLPAGQGAAARRPGCRSRWPSPPCTCRGASAS